MTARKQDRGVMFDAWLPRVQRAVTVFLGAGGIVFGTVTNRLEYWGAAGPLLMWQGYQELRRAGRAANEPPPATGEEWQDPSSPHFDPEQNW